MNEIETGEGFTTLIPRALYGINMPINPFVWMMVDYRDQGEISTQLEVMGKDYEQLVQSNGNLFALEVAKDVYSTLINSDYENLPKSNLYFNN